MNDEITYSIGKEASPLDEPPFRAYFYWRRDGFLIRSADYSKDELVAEIAHLRDAGMETKVYEQALTRLL